MSKAIGTLMLFVFSLFVAIVVLFYRTREFSSLNTKRFYEKYGNNLEEIVDEVIDEYLYAYTGYWYMKVEGDLMSYYDSYDLNRRLLYTKSIDKDSPLISGKIIMSYFFTDASNTSYDKGCLLIYLHKYNRPRKNRFYIDYNMSDNISKKCGDIRMGEKFWYTHRHE